MLKIKCSCGQENELVESPEGLRYDINKHGNGELCNDQCFNCRASLGLEPEPEPEAVKKPTEEAADETVDETTDDGLNQMNRDQLRKRAEKLGIATPIMISKKELRQLIREYLATEKAETGEES